ncbi:MAG: 50S ribosomal protein L25 [Planctomycetaceae bacterium]
MAAAGKLAVNRRTESGSIACRRLRQQGFVPGNMYGHKQDPVPLSASASEVESLIRAGTRVLDVEVEGHAEKVLFREVQWDYLGKEVVHFDLLRIDPNERLEVEVKVELKGTAPGVLAGGVLDHSLRTLHVECLAIQIPDSIVVKISTLEIGHAIHVREIEAPANTKILNNPEAVVVRVAAKVEEPEPTAVAGEEGPAQPEVIGRKAAEEGEEAEEPAEKKK